MQSFQELMTQALTEAGYSDDQVTAALTKIYTHEKLGPKLNALVKTATEDYQAQVGRVKQYQDWYPKAQAEYDRMATEYTRVNKEIEQLRALVNGGGNGDGNGVLPPGFDPSVYMTKQDFMAAMQDSARRYADVIKTSNSIATEHAIRFRESPDMEAIDKIAMEQHLPLRAAYEQYIKPRVEQEEKTKRQEWEKSTRDEIERDLRSRYKLPVETAAPDQGPMFSKLKPEDAPKDVDADLLNAWRSVPAKP